MDGATVIDNKYIVFELEEEEYAIPVESVGAIERILPITRVPGTPRFVKGVVNLRGVVTPVIDLKEKFKGRLIEFNEQTRIIVVNIKEITVGLIVDSANDVIDINKEQIEPSPETINTEVTDFIDGVVKMDNRLFILLDLDKVIVKEDIEELKVLEG
ncbi:MAG TPA: chemotaxis protein CheW [Pseudogracilibacillus sp.]|nr:chemotaxis protein CheW [Pseudogracilibacillus sp.]